MTKACISISALVASLLALSLFTLAGCDNHPTLVTKAMHLDFGGGQGKREINGIGVDNAGNVYVAQRKRHIIHKITPTGQVTILAGADGARGITDGVGNAARFDYPLDISADNAGNVYVSGSHAIRKITPSGRVSTLAGLVGEWHSAADIYLAGDGSGTAARFANPRSMAVDGAGNVYVSDGDDIRKVTPNGDVSTLVVTKNDTGSTNKIALGGNITTDKVGNIYTYSDYSIRKLTSDGVLTTLAGKNGVSGSIDGKEAAARFSGIWCMAVDGDGTVYAVERHTLRKITSAGVVNTIGEPPSTILGKIFGRSHETGGCEGIAILNKTLYLNTGRDIEIINPLP